MEEKKEKAFPSNLLVLKEESNKIQAIMNDEYVHLYQVCQLQVIKIRDLENKIKELENQNKTL